MSKPAMVGMTEEEFEDRLQHSSLGGTVATAKGVHAKLLKASGDYFSNGEDSTAMAFRRFANHYEQDVIIPQSAALQHHINKRIK